MGKARIVSGGEDGLYTVELLHNRDRIEAELSRLTSEIHSLEIRVSEITYALNAAESDLESLNQAINEAIEEHRQIMEELANRTEQQMLDLIAAYEYQALTANNNKARAQSEIESG